MAILGSAKAFKHTCIYPCRTAFPWSLLRAPLHGFESAAVSRRNRAVIACVMMGRLQGNNGRVTTGWLTSTKTIIPKYRMRQLFHDRLHHGGVPRSQDISLDFYISPTLAYVECFMCDIWFHTPGTDTCRPLKGCIVHSVISS